MSTRAGLGGALVAVLALTSAVSAVAAPDSMHPAPGHAPVRAAHMVKHTKHAKPKHKAKRHPAAKKKVAHPVTSTVLAAAVPAAVTVPARLPLPIVPLPVAVPARSASATSSPSPSAAATAALAPSGNASSASASPSPTTTATTTPTASPSATSGASPIAIGVTVSSDDDASDVNAYTSAAGRNPAILMWYSNWSGPIAYGGQMAENDSVGATPMITWDPTDANGNGIPLDDIAAGYYDGYIDSSAALARHYGKPVLIRFAHEMNLSGSPYGPGNTGDTTQSFINAWQHVVTRFKADGASNVRWVWSPNVDCGGGCPFDAFYPGDAYVDYVALDGYNYGSVHNIAPETFTEVFGESYSDLQKLTTKPAMIAETATAGSSTDKAAWIASAFSTEIPNYFPGLKAVVWFDRDKEFDWRVNADAPTLSAWQNVIDSPAYQGTFSW